MKLLRFLFRQISLICLCVGLFTEPVSIIFAEESAEEEVWIEESEGEAEITATITSDFTVTIPKTISSFTKKGDIWTTDFTYVVEGNLQLDEVLRIEPTSTLYQLENAAGEEQVYLTVTRKNTGYITGAEFFMKENILKQTVTLSTLTKPAPDDYNASVCFQIELLTLDPTWSVKIDALNKELSKNGDSFYQTIDENGVAYGDYIISETDTYYVKNSDYCYDGIELQVPIGVNGIGDWSNTTIHSVILPEGVTNLFPRSFADCTELSSVICPKSLHYFSKQAFQNCTSLTEFCVESPYAIFDTAVFDGCSNLTELVLNGTVYTFNENCFTNSGITTIIYHDIAYDVYDETTQTYTTEELIRELKEAGCIIKGTIF